MAHVGRIAGALLVRTRDEWWLVGNTKEPCDWGAHGFEAPPEIDALKRPYQRLQIAGAPRIGAPHLVVDSGRHDLTEGEPLAREVARRMLVERTGSVSERLWRLVLGVEDPDDAPLEGVVARWLVETPDPVWRIVRDAVLRCS
jgi:hypothetical protein